VYDVLGRVIPPGGIPLNVNAVVLNVETAANVALAADRPVTHKFVSVAGAVAEPVTLRVPLGVPLADCVAAAGGPTVPNPVYIVGGVMMGRIEDPAYLVDKATGAVIVLPEEHNVVRRHRRTWTSSLRINRSACDQCSFCTELCPRYLLGHPIQPHRVMRSLMFNQVGQADFIGSLYCCECNLCSMYACPEDLDPRQACGQNKKRLLEQGRKWHDAPFAPNRPVLHMANRKAPTQRLMTKLGLTGFRNVGPLAKKTLAAGKVGIKLKQHVGPPCEAIVKVGQAVHAGDCLGRPPIASGKPAIGAPVHTSIDGTVTAIEGGVIWVEGHQAGSR
jgi:Na+-translocating ferredoxin:NAD+ oxidoreductase RnfC subunit